MKLMTFTKLGTTIRVSINPDQVAALEERVDGHCTVMLAGRPDQIAIESTLDDARSKLTDAIAEATADARGKMYDRLKDV